MSLIKNKNKILSSLIKLWKFQVVLTENQSLEEGEKIANDLMNKLDIEEKNLLSNAYMDLLLNK